MKTKTSRSKTLTTRLAAYSATATAALLVAPAADATVQNITGLDVTLSFAPTTDAGVSFTAGPFHGYMWNHHLGTEYILNMSGNVGFDYGVSRLNFGDSIVDRPFHDSSFLTIAGISRGVGLGKFTPSHQSGYIAFKTGSYYGWLKLKVEFDGGNRPDEVSLIDNGAGIFGAFDKVSDPNIASFKAGDVAPVPEPSVAAIGGLSLLALGAMGVREMRRRRKA